MPQVTGTNHVTMTTAADPMDFYPCRTSPGQDNGGRESEINRGSTRDGDGMLAPKTLETSQEPMETS